MIKKVRIISLILILVSISIILYFKLNQVKDIYVQNRIIDNIFSVDVTGDVSNLLKVENGSIVNAYEEPATIIEYLKSIVK